MAKKTKGDSETAKVAPAPEPSKHLAETAFGPAAKEVGRGLKPVGREVAKTALTLSRTVNVALAPLRGLVWGCEQIEAAIASEMERRFKGRAKQVVMPKLTIAGPAIEAMRFCGQESDLRQLYLNLLATSMDATTAEKAHPGFVEVIRQLTPDEAKIMRQLASLAPPNRNTHYVEHTIRLTPAEARTVCEHGRLLPAYLNNLLRLGLNKQPHTIEEGEPDEYTYYFHLTPYGRQFSDACIDLA
jgi:hypothetical protein